VARLQKVLYLDKCGAKTRTVCQEQYFVSLFFHNFQEWFIKISIHQKLNFLLSELWASHHISLPYRSAENFIVWKVAAAADLRPAKILFLCAAQSVTETDLDVQLPWKRLVMVRWTMLFDHLISLRANGCILMRRAMLIVQRGQGGVVASPVHFYPWGPALAFLITTGLMCFDGMYSA